MSMLDYLKAVLLTQLFYALAVTLLLYSLPADMQPQIISFSDLSQQITMNNMTSDIQNTLTRETQFSVVDLGALALFSGNILLDLFTNFVFALPQMITLLITGITRLIGIDAYITVQVQIFATAVVMIMYFIGLLTLLTNIRSRGTVV
jgi:hypothetical protein